MPSQINNILSTILLILVPLSYWTLTPTNSLPKTIILTLTTIFALTHLIFVVLKHSKLPLPSLKSILPIVLTTTAIIASLFANPEGRPEALVDRGLMYITLSIISVIFLSQPTPSLKKSVFFSMVVTSVLLSLHSLASLLFLSKSPYLPTYMQNASFTPTGNYLTTLTLILVGIALIIPKIKHASNKLLILGVLIINIIATIAITSLMLPGGSLTPTLLPYSASWSIALDALKSIRSLIFGIGLSNYSSLYTAVKPLSLNASSLWNLLPNSGTSEFLTLLPTAGILTTIAFVYFLLTIFIHSRLTSFFLACSLLILGFFFFPISLTLYLYLYLLYVCTIEPESTTHHLTKTSKYVTASFLSLALFSLGFYFGQILFSEYRLGQAEQALQAGNSQQVYDHTYSALRSSPRIANYHLSFADVNFRLASALSQKPELSDSDRQTISQLISQSLSSAKAATQLRPNDSRTHLAVAKIYQNLINVADGAENFAIENYARAISLDRANPLLRVDFAGLLSSIAEVEKNASVSSNLRSQAITELQTSLQLKKDYSNAYYNLAAILEKSGQRAAAISALEETLKYLQIDSQDYQRVNTELETLKSKNSTDNPANTNLTPTSELTTPTPLPTEPDGGPLTLPTP